MAARSIGSGTISFGLVAITVKLYSTVDTTKAVRFNYLSKDGSRLKQQYIRSSDGEVVGRLFRSEIDVYRRFSRWYGYVFFLLRSRS